MTHPGNPSTATSVPQFRTKRFMGQLVLTVRDLADQMGLSVSAVDKTARGRFRTLTVQGETLTLFTQLNGMKECSQRMVLLPYETVVAICKHRGVPVPPAVAAAFTSPPVAAPARKPAPSPKKPTGSKKAPSSKKPASKALPKKSTKSLALVPRASAPVQIDYKKLATEVNKQFANELRVLIAERLRQLLTRAASGK